LSISKRYKSLANDKFHSNKYETGKPMEIKCKVHDIRCVFVEYIDEMLKFDLFLITIDLSRC